jgi:metal-responsive CopG/Arc/MetJ family transcriptional regulator
MKTIQMTIDEALLADVDRAVNELGTSRSAYIRDALQAALRRHALEKLEERQAAGYARYPLRVDEIEEWAGEQLWDQG